MCIGLYPDRLIHETHSSYWVPYRLGRLWLAADRSLKTSEQLPLTDTQWLGCMGICAASEDVTRQVGEKGVC